MSSKSFSEREDEVYEESMVGAAEEINKKIKLNPELQDKIDEEQAKVYPPNLDDNFNNSNRFEFTGLRDGTRKSVSSGLFTGNVSITWEADQKMVKIKTTINELATEEQIHQAVINAKLAFELSYVVVANDLGFNTTPKVVKNASK